MTLNDSLLTPPNGWRYEQPETGLMIVATTLKQLIERVVLHRKNNNLPLGNPVKEVQAYICAKEPSACSDQPLRPKQGFTVSDVRAFLHTVTKLLAEGGKLVEPVEAERRAAICAKCPHNQKVSGCFGCQNVGNLVLKAIGSRATSYDAALQQCNICGCSLAAKVHVPLEIIQQTQAREYEFPEWCWLREGAEETVTPTPIT